MHTLKTVLLLFVCLYAGCAFPSEKWTDQELPLADSEKPLWQWSGWPPPGNMWIGGRCRKVRIVDARTPEQIREELKIEFESKMDALQLQEYKRGGWLVTIGLLMLSLAVAAHCATSLPNIKQLAWAVGLLGLGVAGAGFVQKKTVEFDGHLAWALVILVSLAIAYKLRNWSFTHLFKKEKREHKTESDGQNDEGREFKREAGKK